LNANVESKRNGTLFFLPHSTHWDTAEVDLKEIESRLHRLPAWMHPITICVYWKDFNLGQSRYFARAGYRIVSAGHIFDRNFLFRLFHLCSLHKYSCGVDLGSHIFSSVEAGCRYIHLSGVITKYDMSLAKAAGEAFSISDGLRSEIEEVFAIDSASDLRQKELASRFLCRKQKMTPFELRDFFLFCSALDKNGTGCWRKTRYYSFPTSWQRVGWDVPKRRVKQVLKHMIRKLS
jgi:hypothetical protein